MKSPVSFDSIFGSLIFNFSSSFDSREVTVFETDSGAPTKFLFKKKSVT